jgi:hypothetical protein
MPHSVHQQAAYNEHAQAVEEAKSHGNASVQRLERLLEIVKSAPSAGAASSTFTVAGGLNLSNLSLWISQAQLDHSIAPAQLEQWSDALEAHIQRGSASFEYAKLFGQLFTEWLASKDSTTQTTALANDDVDPEEAFEKLSRKEMLEQREQFEARVLTDGPPVDAAKFKKYMEDLFTCDREAKLALDSVRSNIKTYADSFATQRIQTDTLKETLKSILEHDLLNVRQVSLRAHRLDLMTVAE